MLLVNCSCNNCTNFCNAYLFAVRDTFGDFVSDWKTEKFVKRYDFIAIEFDSLIVLAFYSQAMIATPRSSIHCSSLQFAFCVLCVCVISCNAFGL